MAARTSTLDRHRSAGERSEDRDYRVTLKRDSRRFITGEQYSATKPNRILFVFFEEFHLPRAAQAMAHPLPKQNPNLEDAMLVALIA